MLLECGIQTVVAFVLCLGQHYQFFLEISPKFLKSDCLEIFWGVPLIFVHEIKIPLYDSR